MGCFAPFLIESAVSPFAQNKNDHHKLIRKCSLRYRLRTGSMGCTASEPYIYHNRKKLLNPQTSTRYTPIHIVSNYVTFRQIPTSPTGQSTRLSLHASQSALRWVTLPTPTGLCIRCTRSFHFLSQNLLIVGELHNPSGEIKASSIKVYYRYPNAGQAPRLSHEPSGHSKATRGRS